MTRLLPRKALAKPKVAPPRTKRPPSTRSPVHSMQLGIGRRSSGLPTGIGANDIGPDGRLGLDFSGLAVFERLFVRMPVRLLRAGNNILDLLFYDVHTIPPATRTRVKPDVRL